MMIKYLRLSLAVLILLVSACRPPAPPAAATENELLTPVSFVRSGGFAGLTDQIEIAVDGSYTISHNDGSSESGHLAPDRTQELASLLAQSQLFDSDHSFETPGADQFSYTVTYNGHTVTAVDGAIPDELAGVIDFLVALI